MSRPIITDFQVEPVAHKPELLKSEAAKKLLKGLKLQRIKCRFMIENTYSEVANSIRQSLMCLPSKKLYVPERTVDVSDPDLWETYIAKRISLLPILQNIPENAEFSLNVRNNTDQLQYVYSSEITAKDKSAGSYFDGIYEICSISSGHHLRIPSIIVLTGHNTVEETRHYNLVYDAASIPVGAEPYGDYTGTGENTLLANPRNFLVSFKVNGEDNPMTLAKKALLSLAHRISQFAANAIIESSGDEHEIYMKENLTLGGPISVTIYEMFADEIGCVNFVDRNGILVVRLRTARDPRETLVAATDYLHQVYSDLAGDIV